MKYYGKEKCRILRQIRAEIARQNDIAWVVEECTHKGDCKGTCPRCEAEVRQLEKALERRAALGKTVAVIGISAGLSLSVVGCANPLSSIGGKEQVDGLMASPDDTQAATQEVLDGEELAGAMLETSNIEGEIVVPIPGEEAITDESDFFVDTTHTSDTDETEELPLGGEPVPDDWEIMGDMPAPEDEDLEGFW